VHSTVSLVAEDGLYVVAVLAVVVWLLVPRPEKVAMAVEIVVGLVAVAILVKVAGALHTDPRPFVQNPSLHPWFSHPADNGFPSDHTAVAAMTSFVVLRHRPAAGLLLLAVGALIAASRVVAHVHHVQDVLAGGLIGLVAALLGFLAWHLVGGSSLARRAAGQPATRETASRGARRRP
jgi:membrane-associated phospholipid phosphatase